MDRHRTAVRCALAAFLIAGTLVAAALSSSPDQGATRPAVLADGTPVPASAQAPELSGAFLLRSPGHDTGRSYAYLARTGEAAQPVPVLLERMPSLENGDVSPDGRRITLRLRRSARWQDGEPVTSADVRFTYERIVDPASGTSLRPGWDEIASVETPDPWTVVVRLERRSPAFPGGALVDEPVLPVHLLGAPSRTSSRGTPGS